MRIAIAASMNSAGGHRLTMRVGPQSAAEPRTARTPRWATGHLSRAGRPREQRLVNDSYAAPSPDDGGPGSFI
jgi:hypothetical protein